MSRPLFSPLGRVARARLIFIGLTVAGLAAFALAPSFKRHLGITDHGRWFMDSFAVLAASDALRAGINPEITNPLDPFGVVHAYTDWWYVLGDLGLTRHDNFLVGGGWVLGFLVILWLTLRPRTEAEAIWYAVLSLSPPVLLGFNRANSDLLIFAILGLGALALRSTARWRWPLALAAIAVATGLKFYPVVAAYTFVLLRPGRRLLVALAASIVVLGAVLLDIAPTMHRAMFFMPTVVHQFGGPMIFRDFGWNGSGPVWVGVLILGIGGSLCVRQRWTTGLADGSDARDERILFTLGAIVMTGCFVLTINYSYRAIFGLWLAPWLWREATASQHGTRRTAARVAGWLLFAVMWLEGICCLLLNALVAPAPIEILDRVYTMWRIGLQPFAWALFVMLSGWLLDLALRTRHVFSPAVAVAGQPEECEQ